MKDIIHSELIKALPETLSEMLDRYYEMRGWDKDGVPTPEKLRELGLS